MYNDHKVKPLHIILPKTSAYIKSYDGQTKWVYFLIEDDEILKKMISEKDEKFYLLVFLKECKNIHKKEIRHLNDNLCDFSSSDEYEEE